MSSGRTFVVGDIHGCVEELNVLLDGICPEATDKLIFLGDYIDRGPSPRSVIERLLRLSREGAQCVFLKGNHEDMFLSYLGRGGLYGDFFLRNGGSVTLASYGLEGIAGPVAMSRMPEDHLRFLDSLVLTHEHDGFLCVHAGFDPDRPWDNQEAEDLLWIRDKWLPSHHPYPCTVIFGHTPLRAPLIDLPYKIGLDTGLVYSNCLTALELAEMRLFQVHRHQTTVESMPLHQRAAEMSGQSLESLRRR
jgi:serine/threonine protein phosphatase 1